VPHAGTHHQRQDPGALWDATTTEAGGDDFGERIELDTLDALVAKLHGRQPKTLIITLSPEQMQIEVQA
jgi:hypothetical protein